MFSRQGQFCWCIVNGCCDNLKIHIFQQEPEHCATAVEELCQIYETYCTSKYPLEDKQCILGDNFPEITNESHDAKHYFTWIKHLQQLVIMWKEKFNAKTLTYADIQFYAEKRNAFPSLARSTCIPQEAVHETQVTSVLKEFADAYDVLSAHLIKYVPWQPNLKW